MNIKYKNFYCIFKEFLSLFFLFYIIEIICILIFGDEFPALDYKIKIVFNFISVFFSAAFFTGICYPFIKYKKYFINDINFNKNTLVKKLIDNGYKVDETAYGVCAYKNLLQHFLWGNIYMFNTEIYISKALANKLKLR